MANNLGQSILSDFFILPMGINGGLSERPYNFKEFANRYQLESELYTLEISDDELKQLKSILPSAISFANQLHMDQKQQKLQWKMEKDLAVYEERIKNWKDSKEAQLNLEFGDEAPTGFIKKRRKDKEIEIETIHSRSSQYFKDLTSLSGKAYLKVLAVFFN